MPTKGKKSTRGEGDLYESPKKNTMLFLTDEARTLLDTRASDLGVSRSELVEQFARGLVGLDNDLTKEDRDILGEA